MNVALLVALLPRPLEEMELPPPASALLGAPGSVVVEPARVSYERLTRLPAALAMRLTRGQARRMKLPGEPRAIVIFEPLQYPLAHALLARHDAAELWYLPLDAEAEGPLHERAVERGEVLSLEDLPQRAQAAGIGGAP